MAHSTVRGELDWISQNIQSLYDTVSELEDNVLQSAHRLNAYDAVDKSILEQINEFGNVSNTITTEYIALNNNLASFKQSLQENIAREVREKILVTDELQISSDGKKRFLYAENAATTLYAPLSVSNDEGFELFKVNTESNTVYIRGNLVANDVGLGPNLGSGFDFGNAVTNTIDCETLNANTINAGEIIGTVNVNLDDVVIDSTVIFEDIENVFNLSNLKIPNGILYMGNVQISGGDSLSFSHEPTNATVFEVFSNGEMRGNGAGLDGILKIGDSVHLGDASLTLGNCTVRYVDEYVDVDGNLRANSVATNTLTLVPDLNIGTGAKSAANKYNISIGDGTVLQNANNVSHSIGIGFKTLSKISDASDCIAIGSESLKQCTSGGCVAIGKLSSGTLSDGTFNTSVGTGSLFYCKSGSENSVFGYRSGYDLTGNRSTAIGSYALHTGSDCVALGHKSLQTTYLGNVHAFDNVCAIGATTKATGNNQIILGTTYHDVYSFKPIQVNSDSRDLVNIADEQSGLDLIDKLRPRTYKYKSRDGSIGERRHHGLVVQDLVSNNISDFYQDHTVNGGENVYTIAYEELVSPIIRAIQELHQLIRSNQ